LYQGTAFSRAVLTPFPFTALAAAKPFRPAAEAANFVLLFGTPEGVP
jgi:hypothetical protein